MAWRARRMGVLQPSSITSASCHVEQRAGGNARIDLVRVLALKLQEDLVVAVLASKAVPAVFRWGSGAGPHLMTPVNRAAGQAAADDDLVRCARWCAVTVRRLAQGACRPAHELNTGSWGSRPPGMPSPGLLLALVGVVRPSRPRRRAGHRRPLPITLRRRIFSRRWADRRQVACRPAYGISFSPTWMRPSEKCPPSSATVRPRKAMPSCVTAPATRSPLPAGHPPPAGTT